MAEQDDKKIDLARELKNCRERLKVLFDYTPDAYLLYDFKGIFIDANEKAEKLFGYKKGEVLGQSFLKLNFFSKDQLPKIAGLLAQNAIGKPTGPDEFNFRKKDGSFAILEISTQPVKIQGKTLILAIARDITERKKLEYLAVESAEKFRLFFENNIDAIFVADIETKKLVDCNKMAEKLSGYSKKELLAMSADQLHPKDRVKETMEAFKKQVQEISVVESEILNKSGKRIPVEINAGLITVNAKKYLLGVFRDITERKKSAEAIKKFKILYETSADAIMMLEPPSWKFTSGNPAAIKMFNTKDEQEFTSLGPWDLSPPKQPDGQPSMPKAKKMIEQAMKEGANLFEWTHKKYKGADFYATVLLSKINFGGKDLIQATVRDISPQKETEKKILEQKNNLERMNKLMVDRELKMIELKKKIISLEADLKK